MVGHALEARLLPLILLLVLLEILQQARLVAGGLAPDGAVADLKEEQAVVILAHEVLQIRILGLPLHQSLVEDSLRRGVLHLGQRVELVVDDLLAEATHLDKLHDVGLQGVILEEVALSVHADDVPAERRLHRARDLSRAHGVGCVLKSRDRLSLGDPVELSTLGCRRLVVRVSSRHLVEVGTLHDGAVDRVGTCGVCRHLLGRGLGRHHDEDVRHLAHASSSVDALLCLLVDFVSLGLHVGVVDDCRADLLVAVVEKLALVGRHGVHLRVDGSLHLQLIIDEKVHIFLHRLFVDHSL